MALTFNIFCFSGTTNIWSHQGMMKIRRSFFNPMVCATILECVLHMPLWHHLPFSTYHSLQLYIYLFYFVTFCTRHCLSFFVCVFSAHLFTLAVDAATSCVQVWPANVFPQVYYLSFVFSTTPQWDDFRNQLTCSKN